jgi:hypothetical protein
VPESTVADILWHSNPSMTRHYSMAQIVELHAALEKIKEDTGRWNKSLVNTAARSMRKQCGGLWGKKVPPKSPSKEKRLRGASF